MNIGPIADTVLILIFAGLLVAAAHSDIRRFEIPNRLPVAIVLLFPFHVIALQSFTGAPVGWLISGITAVSVFAVGTALFAFGLFGGGDVKLLSAASLWAGPHALPALLLVMSVTGAGLALAFIARARLAPAGRNTGERALDATETAGIQLPYGVAIALGGLVALVGPFSHALSNWSIAHVV